MNTKPVRLGSTVEDYCSRCKLLLDHAVQAMSGEEISTVVCKTCMHSHTFRHGKSGRRKQATQSLFDQILAKRPPTRAASMPTSKKPSGGGRDD